MDLSTHVRLRPPRPPQAPIASEKIAHERKLFFLDLKENQRRFVGNFSHVIRKPWISTIVEGAIAVGIIYRDKIETA